MKYRIPLIKNKYKYTADIVLDTVTYTFHFSYNARYGRWIMGVGDQIKGIPLLSGIDLLDQYKYLDVPQGRLEMIDTDGSFREADISNIGDSVILQYTSL